MSRSSSSSALHVLRLLWDRSTPVHRSRKFSAAVLCPSDYPTSDRTTLLYHPSPTSASHTASASTSSATTTTEFLEDQARDKEYKLASLLLNPSSESSFISIPWPTIFPPEDESLAPTLTEQQNRTHRCDPLARYVAAGDLDTAKIIYDELKALHIGILHRRIYLDAAISCLDGSATGKEKFLFWLALVPNKPATRPHPKSKAVWAGMTEKLLDLYTQDVDFMRDVMMVLAKKGALPDVLGPLMRHLTMLMGPGESRGMMQNLMSLYSDSVTSRSSPTRRAEVVRSLAESRIHDMWKAYLTALQGAGWQAAARQMLQNPPAGITWSAFTLDSLDPRQANSAVDEEWKARLSEKPSIVRNVIRAKGQSVKPALLADIMEDLRGDGRQSLISRLERRYLSHAGSALWRCETWHHANLLSLTRNNQSSAAVDLFLRHFRLIGIPSHSGLPPPSNENSYPNRRLYPSKGVITTILPHLLALLPTSAVPDFHTSYLALSRTVSPKMQPTAATHSALLRSITHLLGPDAGVLALQKTLEAGYEPGLAAYTALLCSLAGNNRLSGMVDLLKDMEKGVTVDNIRMPTPSRETYLAIAGVLERAGQKEVAEAIRERLRKVQVGK